MAMDARIESIKTKVRPAAALHTLIMPSYHSIYRAGRRVADTPFVDICVAPDHDTKLIIALIKVYPHLVKIRQLSKIRLLPDIRNFYT